MFSQLAHCAELSLQSGIPLYVDWRNTLYSADGDFETNLFQSRIFHNTALPVEVLINQLSAQVAETIKSFRYHSNCDSDCIHDLISGKLPIETLNVQGNGLIVTGPVHMQDPRLLYKNLRALRFRESTQKHAAQIASSMGHDFDAIHYRHGNGEFSDFKQRSDHEAEIANILALYRSNVGSFERPIFIATDSVEADDIFRAIFCDAKNLVFAQKFHRKFGIATHYASIVSQCDVSGMATVFESAASDMLVMSHAKTIFRDSWSSFSNYACAIASQNSAFREIHYTAKRKRFAELSSASLFKDALDAIASRIR